MKKGFLIGGIGLLVVGGAFLGRYFWVRNKRKKIAETLDSKLGGETTPTTSSGSTSGGSSSNLPPIFPLSKGSGMYSRKNALNTVMDLQEALNKLKPTPMKFLIVDGEYGTKTQGMLKAVGQKMPSLGIGNKTSVSKELFDKIVLASKTSGYFTVWR